MTTQELEQENVRIQHENEELKRMIDVLIAQKDLLQSELNLLYLIDESKDGAKSVLISDIQSRTKTFIVKNLMDMLMKHLSYKKDSDGKPVHILDMSFIEYVDFIFCRCN